MIAILRRTAAVAVCLLLASTSLAQGPMTSTELITALLSGVAPGNVFEQFYPNVFDLDHPKKLTFQGFIGNQSATQPAFVDLWFDWIDPRIPGETQTSPVIPIDLDPLSTVPFGLPGGPPAIMFTIPFCPPQVSIHIQNNGPGQLVVVEGQFIHECIPEPGTIALASFALGAIAFAGRRRRA